MSDDTTNPTLQFNQVFPNGAPNDVKSCITTVNSDGYIVTSDASPKAFTVVENLEPTNNNLPFQRPKGNYFSVDANKSCVNPPTQTVAVNQDPPVAGRGQTIVAITGSGAAKGIAQETKSAVGQVPGTSVVFSNPGSN